MKSLVRQFLVVLMPILVIILSPISALAQSPISAPSKTTISEKTGNMQHFEGYFDFWWDNESGKVWLKIDKFDEEFLYVNALAAGMGSNDIGLDRGQLGNTRIVKFHRVGPQVLLVQPNYDYRASSDNALERKSVDEAFAQSILWGFKVENEQDGHVLVDATDFLLRDAHGVTDRLRQSNQGTFSLDKSRSAIYLPGTFNFPKNSEFESMLTFTGNNAGGWVRSVTPSADAITVRQHHSFIELPDDQYKPRKHDPRAGYFGISYQDYSAPIGGDFVRRYISRHRLEKVDPLAEISEAVEPIVYYLDNGTPEPVRSALLDGARWWNEAFEALGYKDAFRVEVLPDDAHPLDVRYNVIQWIHRSTRGWSYGASVRDPRTGEIIKGHVSLGSLRVRQDYMIAEGLLAPYEAGVDPDPVMLEMALARIRQLSAHEIGHTIGIAHNFAASTQNDASVMDYPHPQVTIRDDGTLDLSNAYATGMGAWDIQAVKYGYQHFPDDVDENEALNDIIQETLDMGLLFISDRDARPQGGSHPHAHLWEYGSDPVAQLDHILAVRRLALSRFSQNNIREGRPMASLEDVLVPIYLYHRYQTEATSKLIGGVDFSYSLRGDSQTGPVVVEASTQRAALKALLKTLDASEIALPQHILDIIPPQPYGFPNSREHFRGYTNPTLDPLAMAETASDLTASLIFNPNRAARAMLQHQRDQNMPSFDEIVDQLIAATIKKSTADGYHGAVQRAINVSVLRNMLRLAANSDASPDVQAMSRFKAEELQLWLNSRSDRVREPVWRAHYAYLSSWIDQFKEDPTAFSTPSAPYTPPGAPIGSFDEMCGFWF
jgi:hypothetical protein